MSLFILIRNEEPYYLPSFELELYQYKEGDILINTDCMEASVDGGPFEDIPKLPPPLPTKSTEEYVKAYSKGTNLVPSTFLIDGKEVVA